MLRALAGRALTPFVAATQTAAGWTPLAAATQRAAGWFAIATRTPVSTTASNLQPRKLKKRWWQPILPALAAEMYPNVKGKTGRLIKRQQTRMQQSYSMAHRRIEGRKRNLILRENKLQRVHDEVKEVYNKYAQILRADALKAKGAPELPELK